MIAGLLRRTMCMCHPPSPVSRGQSPGAVSGSRVEKGAGWGAASPPRWRHARPAEPPSTSGKEPSSRYTTQGAGGAGPPLTRATSPKTISPHRDRLEWSGRCRQRATWRKCRQRDRYETSMEPPSYSSDRGGFRLRRCVRTHWDSSVSRYFEGLLRRCQLPCDDRGPHLRRMVDL